jgi:hypothetical protein
MSGHLRWYFASFVVLAGGAISPAFSNPFDALFSAAAPAEAPAPAPVEPECLSHPGKATADGQHWVYRYDGHRKCWFQAAEGTVTARTPSHHHAVKQRHVASEEKQVARRQRETVVEARAELLHAAPEQASQSTPPPAPEVKLVDAAASPTGTVAIAEAPAVANPVTNQLTADDSTPPQVDVEKLLAAAPTTSAPIAASVPAPPEDVVPASEVRDAGGGSNATWLGVALLALGAVVLLSSSWRFWVVMPMAGARADRSNRNAWPAG